MPDAGLGEFLLTDALVAGADAGAGAAAGGLAAGAGEIGAGLALTGAEATGAGTVIGGAEAGALAGATAGDVAAGLGGGAGLADAAGAGGGAGVNLFSPTATTLSGAVSDLSGGVLGSGAPTAASAPSAAPFGATPSTGAPSAVQVAGDLGNQPAFIGATDTGTAAGPVPGLPGVGGAQPGIVAGGGGPTAADPFALGSAAPTTPGGLAGAPPAADTSAWGAVKSGAGDVWNTLSGAINSPTAKVLGTGVAATNLVRSLMAPNTLDGVGALKSNASTLANNGATYSQYLATGTLPPGLQASVNQAVADNVQRIKSSYASRGIAPGSSMEVQEINAANAKAPQVAAQIADQLLSTGLQMSQMSNQIYLQLAGIDQQQSNATGAAAGDLAAALAGGRTTVQLGR